LSLKFLHRKPDIAGGIAKQRNETGSEYQSIAIRWLKYATNCEAKEGIGLQIVRGRPGFAIGWRHQLNS
jgi:hypothetical protein